MVAHRLLLARRTRDPRQRSEMAPERLRLEPGQHGRLYGDPFPSSHPARPYRAGICRSNSPRPRFTRVIPATMAALDCPRRVGLVGVSYYRCSSDREFAVVRVEDRTPPESPDERVEAEAELPDELG
jgi:hypothetical protein